MLRLIFYVLLWVASIGLAIFSSQNINLVTVKFLSFESIKVPIGLLLLFCVGLGANCINILMTSFKISTVATPSFSNASDSKIPKAQTNISKNNNKDKSTNKNRNGGDFDEGWSDDWD